MSLSEHEKRLLDEIEKSIAEDSGRLRHVLASSRAASLAFRAAWVTLAIGCIVLAMITLGVAHGLTVAVAVAVLLGVRSAITALRRAR